MSNKELQAVNEQIEAEAKLVAQMSARDIEQMDVFVEQMERVNALRLRLPMFFTARGNVRAVGTLRISSKNYQAVTDTIDRIMGDRGKQMTVKTSDWTVIIPANVADELRDLKQISVLVIAGVIPLDHANS